MWLYHQVQHHDHLQVLDSWCSDADLWRGRPPYNDNDYIINIITIITIIISRFWILGVLTLIFGGAGLLIMIMIISSQWSWSSLSSLPGFGFLVFWRWYLEGPASLATLSASYVSPASKHYDDDYDNEDLDWYWWRSIYTDDDGLHI